MLLSDISPPEEDNIRFKGENTTADIDGHNVGAGTLYIAESNVAWTSTSGQGFSLEYPNISLHAVSRDTSSYPQECLYLMLDCKLCEDTERKSESSDEEESPTTDVRFIPADKGVLDAMFSAMSECQALHPDEQDTDSEAEQECEYYDGVEGLENLTMDGQRTLEHLENILETGQGDATAHTPNGNVEGNQPTDQGQFEDADMEQ
ncbi:hypothetical protein ScPMuIL_018464 [Solemya velum]